MKPVTAYAQTMLGRQANRYTAVIEATPEEALNWRPGDATTNSFAQLARYVYEGTPWLLGMALGDIGGALTPEARQLRHEHSLRNSPATKDELRNIIAAARVQWAALLPQIDALDLSEEISLFGRPTQRFFYVGLAVDHAAEHLGHAELTRQLWEQRGT